MKLLVFNLLGSVIFGSIAYLLSISTWWCFPGGCVIAICGLMIYPDA